MPFLINSEILHLSQYYLKYPLTSKNCNKRIKAMALLEGRSFFFFQSHEISVKVGSVCLPQVFLVFFLVTEHSIGHFHIRLVQLPCFHGHKGQESLLCKYSLFYYNSENACSDYSWAHLPQKRFGYTPIPSPTTSLL